MRGLKRFVWGLLKIEMFYVFGVGKIIFFFYVLFGNGNWFKVKLILYIKLVWFMVMCVILLY